MSDVIFEMHLLYKKKMLLKKRTISEAFGQESLEKRRCVEWSEGDLIPEKVAGIPEEVAPEEKLVVVPDEVVPEKKKRTNRKLDETDLAKLNEEYKLKFQDTSFFEQKQIGDSTLRFYKHKTLMSCYAIGKMKVGEVEKYCHYNNVHKGEDELRMQCNNCARAKSTRKKIAKFGYTPCVENRKYLPTTAPIRKPLMSVNDHRCCKLKND